MKDKTVIADLLSCFNHQKNVKRCKDTVSEETCGWRTIQPKQRQAELISRDQVWLRFGISKDEDSITSQNNSLTHLTPTQKKCFLMFK